TRQIRKNYHGQLIVNVARDVSRESLPRAAVLDNVMTVRVAKSPPEPVSLRLAVAEFRRRPHLFEARTLEQLLCIQSRVPLRHVKHCEIHAAVGRRVQSRRNPLLILQLALDGAIARSAVRYDIGL